MRVMTTQPVMTVEELAESLHHGRPPTEDDVTILWDGRRIDSKEAALHWLAELDAERAEESAAERDCG
jgi:hypothetical protein